MIESIILRSVLRRAIPRGVAAGAWHPARRLMFGGCVFILVFIIAVLGYRIQGWSWLDSLYMVVITIFGIGYGEVRPVETPLLKTYTIGVIVMGYASFFYVFGSFVQMVIDGEVNHLLGVRRMIRQIEELHNHVVICGYGRMGRLLAEKLASRGQQLLIIDLDETRIQQASDAGHLVLRGNATEDELLCAAGVERAAILATVLSDDVANLFITITARELNPKLRILARAEQPGNAAKFRAVGADQVILPAAAGADRLAQMILRPSAEALLRRADLPQAFFDHLETLGLVLGELQVHARSHLLNQPLAQLNQHKPLNFLVVALRKQNGHVVMRPDDDALMNLGDSVIVLGHEEDIANVSEAFSLDRDLDADASSAKAMA